MPRFEIYHAAGDALEHCVPGPAAEAICKLDYEEWLAGLSARQRLVAKELRGGLNLTDVARLCGVSKAAVQEVRATLARKWDERQGNGRTG